ncbi:MAG TPA: sigma-54 dependent transcriptional regulator [Ignavibacteriales bacterium]|nr:sigma-54 dependent transcriptional regulator [Ignavibacteriales bacterium]
MIKGNVLIIDDEDVLRGALSQLLTLEDYKVFQAPDAKHGRTILEHEDAHVIVSDVRLPDANGIELTAELKAKYPNTEIIVLTAYGTIEDGVKAIKAGAFDYITKGDEDNKILPLVEKAIEKAKMRLRLEQLQTRISGKYNFDAITGASQKIKEAIDMARKVAGTDASVLLIGETGTGKEIFAHSIHNGSSRINKPFVAVNCSAIAKDLLESEMFGYKAGAFTGAVKNKKGLFEEANEGTLFLDEIGDMDVALQSKLLRAIETNSFIKQGDTQPTTVNVRIIAATNKNLEEEITRGHFRSDLYYRLSVMRIEIPPLRVRSEDILPLIEILTKQYSQLIKKNIETIEPEFINKLSQYPFPGNIRELRNIIERAVIISEGNALKAEYLPKEISGKTARAPLQFNTYLSLEDVEKAHIKQILDSVSGNRTKAAEILGIGITTLYRKLHAYRLE